MENKTQTSEQGSETMLIYAPLFSTVSPEALLKFISEIQKIIKGKDLYTVPQKYEINHNLLLG